MTQSKSASNRLPEEAPPVRIDKWLWAARIFKTRTMATEACRAGNVKIQGQRVKPSYNVKPHEIIAVKKGPVNRTLKVLALLDRRVGAKLAGDYVEDLTPESEYRKKRDPDFRPVLARKKGAGRPTKRERRQIDEFLD